MEEKEREIWIGESRLLLGEDNILYQTIVGKIDEEDAAAIQDASEQLRSMVTGKVNSFVDLSRAGKPTPEAREIGKKRIENSDIGKIALFGQHPVARVIAAFVIGITKKKDMRFFKNKEEALSWLKVEGEP